MELGGAGKSAGGLLMEALDLLRYCFPLSGGVADSFVALSGKSGLRWILPAESRKLSSLLAAWQPYSIPTRAGWGLIRLAARGGFLSRLPGTEKLEVDLSATDWRDYGWNRTETPTVIAYVGTPGAHRKLVVTLADPHEGAGHLVVKCPLVDTAWAKIDREYKVLMELRDECQAITPRPLLIDREKRFTVQTYLAGRPVGVRLTDAHYRFLADLYQPDTMICLEEVREQIISIRCSLTERDRMQSKSLSHLESLLNKKYWKGKIPGVRVHGDFAPWNLKWSGKSTIRAVDWEDAQAVGLPFYDLQFYKFRINMLLKYNTDIRLNKYINNLATKGCKFSHEMVDFLIQLTDLLTKNMIIY